MQGLLEDLQADGSCGPPYESGGCGMGGRTCAGRLGQPLQPPEADSSSASTADGPPPANVFMETARQWGLGVHPWTLRQEVRWFATSGLIELHTSRKQIAIAMLPVGRVWQSIQGAGFLV